jgi:hypothetical protein
LLVGVSGEVESEGEEDVDVTVVVVVTTELVKLPAPIRDSKNPPPVPPCPVTPLMRSLAQSVNSRYSRCAETMCSLGPMTRV